MLMSVSLRQDMFAMDRLMEEGEVDAAINIASETKETTKKRAQSNIFERLKSVKAISDGKNGSLLRQKEKHILALCDPDEHYLSRLSGYLAEHLCVPFEILEYTSAEHLCEDRVRREPDMLLISESLYEPMVALASKPFQDLILLEESGTAFLTEDGTEPYVPAWKHSAISKYTSTERIVNKILDHCLSCSQVLRTDVGGNGEKFQVFGVYSPLTRCLQSTFAVTLAQVLAKEGKVLYMTMEPFASLPELQQLQAEYDLSDFLYFFDCYPTKTPLYIEKVKHHIGGFDMIPPVRNYLTMKKVPTSKWEEMFGWIAQYTDYNYLVIDLHEHMEAHTTILSLCDRVFMMKRADEVSEARILQYKELLIGSGLENVWNKTSRVMVPLYEELPASINDFSKGPVGDLVRKSLKKYPYRIKPKEMTA